MNPGKLRHDAQHWTPADPDRRLRKPTEDRGSPVAMLGWAFIGAGIAIALAASTPFGRTVLAMVMSS